MKLRIKSCPICQEAMTIKRWLPINDDDKTPFYSIYCRNCGYGLREAFGTRLQAARTWNAETI